MPAVRACSATWADYTHARTHRARLRRAAARAPRANQHPQPWRACGWPAGPLSTVPDGLVCTSRFWLWPAGDHTENGWIICSWARQVGGRVSLVRGGSNCRACRQPSERSGRAAHALRPLGRAAAANHHPDHAQITTPGRQRRLTNQSSRHVSAYVL